MQVAEAQGKLYDERLRRSADWPTSPGDWVGRLLIEQSAKP